MVAKIKIKKNIVILGAGFAGLHVAQTLEKKLNNSKYQIVLVDKKNIHLYTPDLYEIATAFNKELSKECLISLKSTVATPIKQLIDEEKTHFIQDEVLNIQAKTKTIKLKKSGKLAYEILVVCMGSSPNYFNIAGLEEHSRSVKTIKQALAINCDLDMLFQNISETGKKKTVNIVIGGGGATGVEVAGEMVGCGKKLCGKYKLKNLKVNIKLVEASQGLAAMNEKGTKIVKNALEKQGVEVLSGFKITSAEAGKLTVQDYKGKTRSQNADFLIWTGGVMVNSVVANTLGNQECRGAIEVNEKLQSVNHKNIFAGGDNAFFQDHSTGEKAPMLAQIAVAEGSVIAHNIVRFIKGESLNRYHPKSPAYLLPVGSICILQIYGRVFANPAFWILKRLVAFRYFTSIMSWPKALKKTWHGAEIFLQNDL